MKDGELINEILGGNNEDENPIMPDDFGADDGEEEYTCLDQLKDAVERYIIEHEGKVDVFLGVCAYEGEEFEAVDNMLLSFGLKECVLNGVDDLRAQIVEDEHEFVDWVFGSNEEEQCICDECKTRISDKNTWWNPDGSPIEITKDNIREYMLYLQNIAEEKAGIEPKSTVVNDPNLEENWKLIKTFNQIRSDGVDPIIQVVPTSKKKNKGDK